MSNIEFKINNLDYLDSDQPKDDNWDDYQDFSNETNRCISVIDANLIDINSSISRNNDESLDSQDLILVHFIHLLDEGINNNKKCAITILFWYLNTYNSIDLTKLNIRNILTLLFQRVIEVRNSVLILRILYYIFKYCSDILDKSMFYYFSDVYKTPLEMIDMKINSFNSENKEEYEEEYEELKNIKLILIFFIEERDKISI